MPLNKLDNFIKNTEGRILYVSPADLDATDSIDNQGNSLARPFKTLQRALLESARFSYVAGDNNDLVEKTTILLMPGEHIIDNRPGYAIAPDDPANPVNAVYTPYGSTSTINTDLLLDLNSNFDVDQEDNILYKFNSVYGGVIVPRGTSIVGLDLRKTKVRPKYVPNPTDNTPSTSIFRLTGACYFWQFSFFDGDENTTVYTSPSNSGANKVKPTFSHHKLTCFEYADGVNEISNGLTDLDMYYAKVNRSFSSSSRVIGESNNDRYPKNDSDFSKQRPEWEIVGAFGKDPLGISSITSGDANVNAGNIVTVTTNIDHNLTEETPIKISGVDSPNTTYNISTKVSRVTGLRTFEYTLPTFPQNLNPVPSFTNGKVTIETDTVSGASPYIFNISMRSVWGMNGMHADGSKADGFRSMVVAQFTGVSLQKDDRAFVKYLPTSRTYSLPEFAGTSSGDTLALESSALSSAKIYHLDSSAVYRPGWETTHIRASNDAILQIVSVFAIGYNKHFHTESGADASITNSNSNFGQLSLVSSGFKKESFAKDNNAFITHIIPPKGISDTEDKIDWVRLDFDNASNSATKLYISGYTQQKSPPPSVTQGFRIGAKHNDKLYVEIGGITKSADIIMDTGEISKKEYNISSTPTSSNQSLFTVQGTHNLSTGESVKLYSDSGDLPENIAEETLYYVIRLNNTTFKLSSSQSDANNGEFVNAYGGTNLRIVSRVSDKTSGEVAHPIQYDENGWFITVTNSTIWDNTNSQISGNTTGLSEPTYVLRTGDTRSLDDKLYKVRIVVPKEFANARDPESGFIIQESSSTGLRDSLDDSISILNRNDYGFNKNNKLISTCTYDGGSDKVTVLCERPHDLNVGDTIIVKNVKSSDNVVGTANSGFNGTFSVSDIDNLLEFKYSTSRSAGDYLNQTVRDENYPRIERNDNQKNLFLYRNEIIQNYIQGERDGIYHAYVLNSDYEVPGFSNLKYGQNVVNLYPQLDRDNVNDNPPASKSYALRSPLGKVVTNDVKNSLTKEAIHKLNTSFGHGKIITNVTESSQGISTITFDRDHGLQSISEIRLSSPGSGYPVSDGVYYGVKLKDTVSDLWKGATAKIQIQSGSAIDAGSSLIHGGSGYGSGETFKLGTEILGTPTISDGTTVALASTTIISSIGNVVQFTGFGTSTDSYHRIVGIDSTNKVAIGRTDGDPIINNDQYAYIVGPSIDCTITSSGGISTISAPNDDPIGLVVGNKFKLTDDQNNNVGDYVVDTVIGVSTVTIKSEIGISDGYILKHGLSSNIGNSDKSNENLDARASVVFDNVHGKLSAGIVTSTQVISVTMPNSGDDDKSLSLGSYIVVNDEYMRVKEIDSNNDLVVIRGAFGTRAKEHSQYSIVKKVSPTAIEFRRPSIIRASGHTFEYLGYGPGNYSTGLPQVQDRTLNEREEFLSQSQERESGVVVYTGMNNKGDFFIGNQKKSSSTGEEITFDTPIPTVTGEKESRLSSVFDEVTIKDRLVVEGGDTKQILSQFDGPVTFNKEVTTKHDVNINANLTLKNGSIIGIKTDVTIDNGDKVYFGDGETNFITDSGDDELGIYSDDAIRFYHDNSLKMSVTGIGVSIGHDLYVTGDITAFWTSDERLKDNITPIEDPLAKVVSISGNTFDWNDKSKKRGTDTGLIAQEVESLGLPGLVVSRDNGYLAVDYHKVVPLLVEAIKELSNKVDSLEQRLNN